ncbi:MAG: IclR family transcriptional regulator [Alicyclobacillus sp.]|nr:IclR family transcriptional regulator [Alicyclobacillus sp.]
MQSGNIALQRENEYTTRRHAFINDSRGKEEGIADVERINQSALHTTAVLDCFRTHPVLRVRDISRLTGMHKSTVHHILSALVQAQWLERNEAHEYRLSYKLLELSQTLLNHHQVRDAAQPFARTLAHRWRAVVLVSALLGQEAVYVDRLVGERVQALWHPVRVGSRVPLEQTASGKLYLAYLPNLAQIYLQRMHQAASPERVERLRSELDQVRAQGYALDLGQMDQQLAAVSAPIAPAEHGLLGAMTVVIPRARWQPADLARLARQVQASARDVATLLTTEA